MFEPILPLSPTQLQLLGEVTAYGSWLEALCESLVMRLAAPGQAVEEEFGPAEAVHILTSRMSTADLLDRTQDLVQHLDELDPQRVDVLRVVALARAANTRRNGLVHSTWLGMPELVENQGEALFSLRRRRGGKSEIDHRTDADFRAVRGELRQAVAEVRSLIARFDADD